MWWKSVTCALIALELSALPARAEQACRVQPGNLRDEDNIDCFRDPAARQSFPGSFKFIPLGGNGDAYASIGGEIRQRYTHTHDPLFGEHPRDDAGFWLQRYTLHGDFHLGPQIRVFGQLSSALEAGRDGGPGLVDENELALQNAFVDVSFAPAEGPELTLRAGRQELLYGSGRLVDVREGPNVRRTFDAVRAVLTIPEWRIDALAARPRSTQPGVFDDEVSDGQTLWGIYATGGGDLLPFGGLDLYYLGFEDDEGVFAQGTAREHRHSVGARYHGNKCAWDWNWEVLYQFGRFGEGDISAWTIATETGVTFVEALWRPRVALSTNIASGDDDPSNADFGAFNALFPRGNYFSEAAVLGPRNFFNLHPFATVHPNESSSLTADVNFFWRLETHDGVYAPSGQLIRAPGGSDERFVGTALSVTLKYQLAHNLGFTAIYTHFFPGDFIRDTGPSEAIDFFEVTLQLKY